MAKGNENEEIAKVSAITIRRWIKEKIYQIDELIEDLKQRDVYLNKDTFQNEIAESEQLDPKSEMIIVTHDFIDDVHLNDLNVDLIKNITLAIKDHILCDKISDEIFKNLYKYNSKLAFKSRFNQTKRSIWPKDSNNFYSLLKQG